MAGLTFAVKYQGRIDNKKLKIYDVTHDGSDDTINASEIGLNYVDIAMITASTVVAQPDLTTATGKALVTTAMSSGTVVTLWALGT